MAKRIKRQFHCEKCGSGCNIYKKGKNHRVLVCPTCGVLATNPLSLKGIAKAGASLLPGGGLISAGLDLLTPSTPKPTTTATRVRESYTAQQRINDALR